MKHLGPLIIAYCLLLGTAGAQQTPTSTGGSGGSGQLGGTAGNGGATPSSNNSGGGNPGGQGANASSLQSEAKVLTYDSIADAMDNLVTGIASDSSVQADTNNPPAFFLTEPCTTTDVANLFELKRLLNVLNSKLAAVPGDVANSSAGEATDTTILDAKQTVVLEIEASPETSHGARASAAAGASTASTSTSAAAAPGIKELSGLGADATQIGLITDAISGILTMLNSFHSPYTTSGGALGLDQPTINSMLASRLLNHTPKIRVFDYTQGWMDEDEYDDQANDSTTLLGKLRVLIANIDAIDAALTVTKDSSQNPIVRPVDFVISVTTFAQRVATDIKTLTTKLGQETDPTKASALQDNLSILQNTMVDVQGIENHMQNATDGLAILKTAADFYQLLVGTNAPQYTFNSLQTLANSTSSNNATNSNAQTTVSTPGGGGGGPGGGGQGGAGGGNTVTVNVSGQGQSQNGAQGQSGNQSAAANPLTTNYINFISKYATIDLFLGKIKGRVSPEPKMAQSKPPRVYLISCRVIVGDATESKVTRFLLEDYVALSNRAVVQVQVYDPFTAEYLYSNEARGTHNYVYFPSRVRDSAENGESGEDQLCPSYYTAPRPTIPPKVPRAAWDQ